MTTRKTRPKTKCPSCGSRYSKIIEGRDYEEYDAYYRRRECFDCGQRYRTEEVVRGITAKKSARA